MKLNSKKTPLKKTLEPISGKFGATFNYQAGDVGVVPFSMAHYIENIGSTTLRFLEIFRSDNFVDVSLAQWLALTPHELVKAHLNIKESVLAKYQNAKRLLFRNRLDQSREMVLDTELHNVCMMICPQHSRIS